MDGKVVLYGTQRERLLEWYRQHPDGQVRLRAHVILLLADGLTWTLITAVLYCSSKTIARWKRQFEADGLDALLGEARGRPARLSWHWAAVAVGWVKHRWPGDFGLRRSRWCCRTLVVLLLEVHQVRVSEETVRRWLHQANLVWRRPRPVLGRPDPQREVKLAEIRGLVAQLPADETAVFQDEVQVDTNPKIGSMWMLRGQQAKVDTPGSNEKRHLAGSLNWTTGHLVTTVGAQGQGRNTDLFLAHLDDLRRHYRRYRVIHVICDNAIIHTCRRVQRYLAGCGGRIVLHYLPLRAPETNPIERVWWKLHEAITRNHRCRDMDALLEQVLAWLVENSPFAVEDQEYFPLKQAA